MRWVIRLLMQATYRDQHGYQAMSKYDVRRGRVSWVDMDEQIMINYYRGRHEIDYRRHPMDPGD